MQTNRKPKIAPELIWQLQDDQAVIVAPHTGKINVFNGIGTIIWQLLDAHCSAAEIEAHLVKHYEVSPEQARGDLAQFLTNLDQRGLLVWEA